MKRGLLLLMPLALAALVFAQAADDPAELVKKLGAEDYTVREEAQKKLIEMGEKAVPALEEALKSDDLEVRLRAGRALRAIGSKPEPQEAAPDAGQQPATPGIQQRMTSFQVGPDGVVVTVTRTVDGKQETKTYKGTSLEELKEKYPELKDQLGTGFQFHFGSTRDDQDMDKFWKDMNRGFDDFDEDVRNWQRDLDSMRRWLEHWQNQPHRMRQDQRLAIPGAMLGVRVSVPTPVLDAQLELRGRGLVVDAVEKDSLADRLGLQRFDILIELNGHEIHGADDVAAALQGAPAGTKVTAKIFRRAQEMTVSDEGKAARK
jgi:hypothetical protein